MRYIITGCLFMCVLCGCATSPTNPSFPITVTAAQNQIDVLQGNPQPLHRPLIILSGWADPGLAPLRIAHEVKTSFNDDRIMMLSFPLSWTFARCRQAVIRKVGRHFPSDDPNETICVDVVAHSMGGLVARYAAMPLPNQPRLRMARLFTIASPHRGAILAELPLPDQRVWDMQRGASFIKQLDESLTTRDYQLVCYVRLGDRFVGPRNAAPEDVPLWWIPNRFASEAHLAAPNDPRILLDIILRLRNAPPITRVPAAPLPPRRIIAPMFYQQ